MFSQRRRLNWMQRFKFQASFLIVGLSLVTLFSTFTQGDDDAAVKPKYRYNDHNYKNAPVTKDFSRGQMVVFYDTEELCDSYVLIPGVILMNNGVLAFFYLIALLWLFLGISVVSDVFMGAIEVITSSTKAVKRTDPVTNETITVTAKVWNPTLANLTLMALGSSAPEILLSVIETCQSLGQKAGELGPSTIVGSAAFNLMVISAVSVVAVGPESAPNEDANGDHDPEMPPKGVKKVADTGVFAITCTASVFAYVWLYLVLEIISKDIVETWEAFLTLAFFFILVTMAFIADKINAKNQLAKEAEIPPYSLAEIMVIISTMSHPEKLADIPENKRQEFETKKEKVEKFLMKEYGRVPPFEEIDKDDLKHRLHLDPLLPRISARKKFGAAMTGKREIIKGQKYMKKNVMAKNLDEKLKNPTIGFEVLHYSVSEAQGFLEISIIKKVKDKEEFQVGVRTRDGEAIGGDDYEPLDEVITFSKGQQYHKIKVKIIDDDGWEPDENFFVVLYDPKTGERLKGEDTETRVTIIDDDKPGYLLFEKRLVPALTTEKQVMVTVTRKDGADGDITVEYNLEEATEAPENQRARSGIEFASGSGTLTFEHMVTEKQIKIDLFPSTNQEPREGSYFYVRLSKAKPPGVKLNTKDNGRCRVEIVNDANAIKKSKAELQLLEAVQRQEEPSISDQLKEACMLYPTKNDDGEIEDVTALEATLHFASIGWKVLFAFIPPKHKMGGWLCFVVSLAFIGGVTAIVGEIASLFGCVCGLKPAVTAITFVALGTSLPDTFASKTAAQDEKHADAAIGNVTGSNSVNVFLGLGLPWVIGALYSESKGVKYEVPAGALAFSVMLFLITSITCIFILLIRRKMYGGELGGPKTAKYVSGAAMCLLWFIYVIFSSLRAYSVI